MNVTADNIFGSLLVENQVFSSFSFIFLLFSKFVQSRLLFRSKYKIHVAMD